MREKSKSTPPGVARQLVTFFCLAKKKVTKEKATQVCRRCAVPSINPKQAGLRNSRYALSSPRLNLRLLAADRGGAQGNKAKIKTKKQNQKAKPKSKTKKQNQKAKPKSKTKKQNQKAKPKSKTKKQNQKAKPKSKTKKQNQKAKPKSKTKKQNQKAKPKSKTKKQNQKAKPKSKTKKQNRLLISAMCHLQKFKASYFGLTIRVVRVRVRSIPAWETIAMLTSLATILKNVRAHGSLQ